MLNIKGTIYLDKGVQKTKWQSLNLWRREEEDCTFEEFYVNNKWKIKQNWSNCGVLDICNFGESATTLSIKRMEKEILEFVQTYNEDFSGHFLVGTINSHQKEVIGKAYEKCGWEIKELFLNNNSNSQCYLITKDLLN